MPKPIEYHHCESPKGDYYWAYINCKEDEEGLWLETEEVAYRVPYCPFCGWKYDKDLEELLESNDKQ